MKDRPVKVWPIKTYGALAFSDGEVRFILEHSGAITIEPLCGELAPAFLTNAQLAGLRAPFSDLIYEEIAGTMEDGPSTVRDFASEVISEVYRRLKVTEERPVLLERGARMYALGRLYQYAVTSSKFGTRSEWLGLTRDAGQEAPMEDWK